MIEKLGLTPQEFHKGFIDFVSNRKLDKSETGTLLDNIFKNGIPTDKITMVIGTSGLGNMYHEYIEKLINSKK